MSINITKTRIPAELRQLQNSNNKHGITCAPAGSNKDNYSQLIAKIPGPKGSPYEGGIFEVNIGLGTQYPFQPPTFKLLTPIYHPNIDNSGKICLDLLRMPPTGSYNPTITLESILLSIQLLLASPNPDDPLNGEAADLFKTNRELYNIKASESIHKADSTAGGSEKSTSPTKEGPSPKRVKSS
ncbi:ubiquitin-conjugating enzyme E2 T-like [Anastrepha ludens]|uniref:ubiquitin-conjugating enzyme E2 T-like n=1 Tax=Anastrepha ludens TaxID=28586 RepID=UPI0023AF8D58|nr:ubiquitin-conjugating enzyme E2 T-like [Anastrepha ludens]